MGIRNVNLIYTYWMHLGHREVRLLTYMSMISMDAATPPVYFGGWEAAAVALGLDPRVKRASAKESFRQVVASLTASGAIVSSGHARTGSRAEYAVSLDPAVTYSATVHHTNSGRPIVHWQDVPREGRGNDSLPHDANDPLPQVGQRSIGNRGNESLPPRRTQEQLQEYREESHHQAGHVTSPVDNSGQNQIEIPEPQSDSARAYLNDRPGQHADLMQQARLALGNDADLSHCMVHAARAAGWTWKEQTA